MARLSAGKKVAEEENQQEVTANFGGEDTSGDVSENPENHENKAGEEKVDGEKEPAAKNDVVVRSPNLVQIRTNQNHKCTIGGVRYIFKKGGRQNVPEDVKRVLYNAGLLTSL